MSEGAMREKEDFYKDENEQEKYRRESTSPSGTYKLVIRMYGTREGCWNYTRGTVYKDDQEIADVQRNYSQFPFSWIEGHKNGHDYLVCGEDYQGQTVVELDTGKRVDYLPPEAEKGHGFCWAGHEPSPDGTLLGVAGCYWACPYEARVYDFTDPMSPPYEVLFREDLGEEEDDDDVFCRWKDDATCELSCEWGEVKETGRPEFDLDDEEKAALKKRFDESDEPSYKVWHEIFSVMQGRVTWNREKGVIRVEGNERE
jgi:hypothetical protein